MRPRFVKGASTAVTDAGRKAINRVPDRRTFLEDEAELKAWKFREVWVCAVLEWVVGKTDVSTCDPVRPAARRKG